MKMNGERLIPAARQTVWEALNDPETLKACITGCESLEKTSDTEMSAEVTAKVGPVKAKFAGTVELSDINAPESYRISGQGKGGAAGFAKGGASVKLDEAEGGTLLTYDVDAQVGGKLAQIGSRLVSGTAKKMADDFFDKFAEKVGGDVSAPAAEEAAAASAAAAVASPAQPEAGSNRWIWIIGGIVLLGLIYLLTG